MSSSGGLTEEQREVSQRAREILGSLKQRRERFESQIHSNPSRFSSSCNSVASSIKGGKQNGIKRNSTVATDDAVGSVAPSIKGGKQNGISSNCTVATDDAVVPPNVIKPLPMRPSLLTPEETKSITNQLDSSLQGRKGRLVRMSGSTRSSLEAKLDELVSGKKTGTSAGFSSPVSEHSTSQHTAETGELTASPSPLSSPEGDDDEDGWGSGRRRGRFLDARGAAASLPCPPLEANSTDDKTIASATISATKLPPMREKKQRHEEKNENKSSLDAFCEKHLSRTFSPLQKSTTKTRGEETITAPPAVEPVVSEDSPSRDGSNSSNSHKENKSSKSNVDKKQKNDTTLLRSVDGWAEENLPVSSRDIWCDPRQRLQESPPASAKSNNNSKTVHQSPVKQRQQQQQQETNFATKRKVPASVPEDDCGIALSKDEEKTIDTPSQEEDEDQCSDSTSSVGLNPLEVKDLVKPKLQPSLSDEYLKAKLDEILASEHGADSSESSVDTELVAALPQHRKQRQRNIDKASIFRQSPLETALQNVQAMMVSAAPRSSFDETPKAQKPLEPILMSQDDLELPKQLLGGSSSTTGAVASPQDYSKKQRRRQEPGETSAAVASHPKSPLPAPMEEPTNASSNHSSSSQFSSLGSTTEQQQGRAAYIDQLYHIPENDPRVQWSRSGGGNMTPRRERQQLNKALAQQRVEQRNQSSRSLGVSPKQQQKQRRANNVSSRSLGFVPEEHGGDDDVLGHVLEISLTPNERDALKPPLEDETPKVESEKQHNDSTVQQRIRVFSVTAATTTPDGDLESIIISDASSFDCSSDSESSGWVSSEEDEDGVVVDVPSEDEDGLLELDAVVESRGEIRKQNSRRTTELTSRRMTRQKSPLPKTRRSPTTTSTEPKESQPEQVSSPRRQSPIQSLPGKVTDRTSHQQPGASLSSRRQQSALSPSSEATERTSHQSGETQLSPSLLPPKSKHTAEPNSSRQTVPRRQSPMSVPKRQASEPFSPKRQTTSEPSSQEAVPRQEQAPPLSPPRKLAEPPKSQRVNYVGRRKHVQIYLQSVLSDLDEEEERAEERKEPETAAAVAARQRKEQETAAAIAARIRQEHYRTRSPRRQQPPRSGKTVSLSRPAYLLVAEETANALCGANGGLYTLAVSSGMTKNTPIPVQGQGALAKSTTRANKGYLCLSTDFRCGAHGSLYDLAVRSGCKVDEPMLETRKRAAPKPVAVKEKQKVAVRPRPYIPAKGGHYLLALESGLTRKALRSKRGYTISTTTFRDSARTQQQGKATVVPEEVSDLRCGTTGTLYLSQKSGIEFVPVTGSLKSLADRTGMRF